MQSNDISLPDWEVYLNQILEEFGFECDTETYNGDTELDDGDLDTATTQAFDDIEDLLADLISDK